jgi:RND family efflux transporter MFP subunit
MAMFGVGIGAVYLSTVGSGGTQAAATGFLTSAASLQDVSRSAAATGTVASADSFSLVFGETARPAGSAAASTGTASWTVEEVLVSVGDRVTAGQLLATASSDDLETDLALTRASLDRARITLAEAEKALADAKGDLREQLVDARSSLETARLSLRNAREQRSDATAGAALRQARIAVLQAQDQLRQAQRTVADLEEELAGDLPTQAIAVSEARASVVDLEAQVADLEDQLGHAQLVSPADGIVTAADLEPGYVAPVSDAVTIDSATLDVVADVTESDVASVALGQAATVSIDALDLEASGTVTAIAATTDGGTSSVVTFPVTITLTDPDGRIKPGMSTDVEITIAQASGVVAVPAVALAGSDGSYLVTVAAADGSVELRPVTVGLVTETLAEIQSGLAEGEEVVVGTSTDRAASEEDSSSAGGLSGMRALEGGGAMPFQGGRPPGAGDE